jgi:hypothetical protein
LAGLVYYSGLNFARDVGTFYSLFYWDVCSGVVWSFEGKLKNLKECLILFFLSYKGTSKLLVAVL